jgi:hypothetical protein
VPPLTADRTPLPASAAPLPTPTAPAAALPGAAVFETVRILGLALTVRDDPELLERVLVICEQEQRNSMASAGWANDAVRRGQFLGGLTIALLLGLAAYVAGSGAPGWAAIIAGIDVAGIAGTLMIGHLPTRPGPGERRRRSPPKQ